MNAFRKPRLAVFCGLLAVLALSVSISPAEAGNHHKGHHHFHKFHKVHSGFHYGHYYPAAYQPHVKYVAKPYRYPVTLIDCHGHPYVVWQTSYQTVPTTYYPY